MRLMRWYLPALSLHAVTGFGALLVERGATSCDGNAYTTPSGLSFDLYCGTNIGADVGDFDPPVYRTTDDVYACMQTCSTYGMCYGVTYTIPTKNCTLKGNGFTQAIDTAKADKNHTHSAAVGASQASELSNGYSTDCGYVNGTTHNTYNGMPFTVACGMDLVGSDYCPAGNASCPSHAASFQDCINQCAQSHPLCWGVSYNPDMVHGFTNCYLKDARASKGLLTPSIYASGTAKERYVTHTAQVFMKNGTGIAYNCTRGMVGNGTNKYAVYCNTDQVGNDIWSQHTDTLEECTAACTTHDGCIAVMYDPRLVTGWENCLLKSAVPRTSTSKNVTLAVLSSSVNSTLPSSDGGDSSSKSKAWIAGPVVGGIVIIAAIVGLVLLTRRRRQRQGEATELKKYEKAELDGTMRDKKFLPMEQPLVELEGKEGRAEMPHQQERPSELAG